MALEFDTFEIPYYRAIPSGLNWVMVEGFIPQQSNGFQLELKYGQFSRASVPLRFKLSFEGGPSSSPATAFFNSYTDGQWEKENKTTTHLRQGQKFKVQIIATSKGYKILENDIFLFEFDHRLSAKKIRFFEMQGDVRLEGVVFDWETRNPTLPKYGAGRPVR